MRPTVVSFARHLRIASALLASGCLLWSCGDDAGSKTPKAPRPHEGEVAGTQPSPNSGNGADDSGADDESASARDDGAEGPAATDACPKHASFESLDWLPPSRFALLLARSHPDAEATLRATTQAGALDPLELPVHARFELDQLAFAVPSVHIVARELGLDPAQLVLAHDADGRSTWFVPAPCDGTRIEALAKKAYKVRFRSRLGARVASPSDAMGEDVTLPFDIVVLDDDVVALASPDHGGALARWIRGGHEALVDATRPRAGEALTQAQGRAAEAAAWLRLEGAALAGAPSSEPRVFAGSAAGWTPMVDSGK